MGGTVQYFSRLTIYLIVSYYTLSMIIPNCFIVLTDLLELYRIKNCFIQMSFFAFFQSVNFITLYLLAVFSISSLCFSKAQSSKITYKICDIGYVLSDKFKKLAYLLRKKMWFAVFVLTHYFIGSLCFLLIRYNRYPCGNISLKDTLEFYIWRPDVLWFLPLSIFYYFVFLTVKHFGLVSLMAESMRYYFWSRLERKC